MKLEFEDRDFEGHGLVMSTKEICAQLANAKLEKYIKEHGKVAWCYDGSDLDTGNYLWWTYDKDPGIKKYKAILINIEPIQKCDHPKEKVDCESECGTPVYICECGAKVYPKLFSEEP